ncbi:MAG TPA: SAM-dependent methyltransferase [Solirubrobacteraceae bacterium]|nr:SAM-dependent methyltransferase [Solirubrobacteraceae bacterium]
MSGRVIFAGCGPGAADLLTLRAARAIAEADIVVWGRALLDESAVRDHARPDAEVIAWPPATMREVDAAYDRACDENLTVVRLKSGDPAVFGQMEHELSAVRERGLAVEIVPGVSALGAAAAALGVELTTAGTLAIGAADGPRQVGAAVLFMPGGDGEAAARALRAQGLGDTDPCVIAHRISWPGELVVECPLGELAERLDDLALGGMTLVLAGAPISR